MDLKFERETELDVSISTTSYTSSGNLISCRVVTKIRNTLAHFGHELKNHKKVKISSV
jgi:hypothetical protein